jgi:hypothetical protein
MKAATDTLGVARSNVVERVRRSRPKRGPQTRDGDLELCAKIRRSVDAWPPTDIGGLPRFSSANAAPPDCRPSMPSGFIGS